jgi:hypothetical protein
LPWFPFSQWASSQPAHAYADAVSSVGVVDYVYLINNDPNTPAANQALRAAQAAAKQEFDAKASSLSDQDKQALSQQLGQQVAEAAGTFKACHRQDQRRH